MNNKKNFELNDDALDAASGGCWSDEPIAPIVGGYHPQIGERVIAYCPYCEADTEWCRVLDYPDPDIHPGEYMVKCFHHCAFYTRFVSPAPPQTTGDPFL